MEDFACETLQGNWMETLGGGLRPHLFSPFFSVVTILLGGSFLVPSINNLFVLVHQGHLVASAHGIDYTLIWIRFVSYSTPNITFAGL